MEKETMESWKNEKIFEESMSDGGRPAFSFYDGPPFATGLPHYGHVVASLIKDAVPRYWTMKGRRVDRRWGWDCHGLPVENLIEKELGIENKQQIEKLGVDKFNEACCGSVQRYAKEWKEFIPRVGRWVDMENDYRTMDWKYTESIWWVFSEVYKKGLAYEGYKAMHLCPRCETTLSNFEVTQGYKDVTDISATVKFKLTKESAEKILHTPSPSQEGNDADPESVEGEKGSHSERSDSEVKNPELMQDITGSFAKAQDGSDVYILAWTTTPWTLPGNVALAVGEDIEYVMLNDRGIFYILSADIAKQWREKTNKEWIEYSEYGNFPGGNPNDKASVYQMLASHGEEVKRFKGKQLVGLEYEPLFNYYAEKEDLVNRENGWKIYAGDFVTTEEGVGVVHIAPAFGEDDMRLGREEKLPFVQHVSRTGHFVDFMDAMSEDEKSYFVDKEGQGREVKPKRNSRETDEHVKNYLNDRGKLFAWENYKHSYPHCWRCDTPLLNYASGSWFVEVTKLKDSLVKNNQQVNWVPGYIKDGRFGKWLEDARDWAISRSRFWGAPLPIWKCADCGKTEVIGSIDELRAKTDRKITKFIFARHGIAESNILGVRSSGNNNHHLAPEGRKQSEDLARQLKNEKVDIILSSPVMRAMETAEIIAEVLDMPIEKSELIREMDYGAWDGFTNAELQEKNELYRDYKKTFGNVQERYNFRFGGDGESRVDAEKRVGEFIGECIEKYPGKNILVVAHGIVGAMLEKILNDLDVESYFAIEMKIQNAKTRTFYVREDGKRFDLHKPYIDEICLACPECGRPMKIVGDVFDCWFESGSMPYAQLHYPFENKEKFETSYPADFIAEGIDQTRGWFYTLMVLSTALFDKPAFKNVIVNGIVLAEDGQKMSKKLKNYPDPNVILEKYGADALRYYLFTSPVMKAENLRFSEKGVDEVLKKFVLTLWNTYSFFVMNAELGKIEREEITDYKESDNLLDRWIISELNLLISEVDREMQDYDLVKASRPLMDFMDELSNWYVRRSRRRFTSEAAADRLAAYHTLYHVLVTFTKLMAPFMPFIADEIFKNLTDKKSVHLERFPEADSDKIDNELSKQMEAAREVVTLGLAVRAQNRMKVRMPLRTLSVQKAGAGELRDELIDILKDELNVKEVEVIDAVMEREGWGISPEGSIRVALDLNLTEELELEGAAREVIRQIQAMRKNAKYERDDIVSVKYSVSEGEVKARKMFGQWTEEIRKECLLRQLDAVDAVVSEEFDGMAELDLSGEKVILGIKK